MFLSTHPPPVPHGKAPSEDVSAHILRAAPGGRVRARGARACFATARRLIRRLLACGSDAGHIGFCLRRPHTPLTKHALPWLILTSRRLRLCDPSLCDKSNWHISAGIKRGTTGRREGLSRVPEEPSARLRSRAQCAGDDGIRHKPSPPAHPEREGTVRFQWPKFLLCPPPFQGKRGSRCTRNIVPT